MLRESYRERFLVLKANDNNFYTIRCQLYNHRGGGFVVEIVEKENEFLLYHQTDAHNPRREKFKIGRIDFEASFETLKLKPTDIEQIITKVSEIRVPFLPPLTGGFDGIDYKIWISNGMSVIHASWWMDCPPQWSQLQKLWQFIVELAETQ